MTPENYNRSTNVAMEHNGLYMKSSGLDGRTFQTTTKVN